jgi:phosphoglycolate phosphatase-like HAD superfamily hydrolase
MYANWQAHRYAMKSLLIAWDFHGVLDTYGAAIETVLQAIADRGGENIVVSHSEQPFIEHFLAERSLRQYFAKVYGMHLHHGRNEQHKVAALMGHECDYGPYQFKCMVGDTLGDMNAGKSAGFVSCLFDPYGQQPGHPHQTDFVVRELGEVVDLLPV